MVALLRSGAAAGALDRVHRLVGPAQEALRGVLRLRRHRADGEVHGGVAACPRLTELRQDPPDDLLRQTVAGLDEDEGELVAADAEGAVGGPQARLQDARD